MHQHQHQHQHHQKAQDQATAGHVIHWARRYDLLNRLLPLTREMQRAMVEVSDPVAGQRVVDVGCGTGALAIALKAKVGHGEVYGIDASPEMIEVAKRKAAKVGSDVEFRVALIEALPFADDSFDLVTSSLMLHHLPEGLKPKALREVRRVLKPGGRFLALDLSTMSHSPLGHLLTLLGRSHGASMVEELMPLLRDAGFEDVVALPTRSRSFFLVRAR